MYTSRDTRNERTKYATAQKQKAIQMQASTQTNANGTQIVAYRVALDIITKDGLKRQDRRLAERKNM